ncbi:MAG: hypothetical protein BA863_01600 [Desulfovibrio sp. S3730MH75]|nr:MAG: hypothetical protein BA863_01600 [Desulfovibrio sp. S3730MH75]
MKNQDRSKAGEKEKSDKSVDEDVIKEPFIELTLQAHKVRRNLLSISLLSCAILFFGGIDSSPSILGVSLKQLTPERFNWCIFLITLYFWAYFTVLSFQTVRSWWLRKSGYNALELAGGYGGPLVTSEQSTLLPYIASKTQSVINQLKEIEEETAEGLSNVAKADFNSKLMNLESALKSFESDAKRITPLLHSFKNYQRSYLLTFFIEFIIPSVLGLGSWVWMLYYILVTPVVFGASDYLC